MSEFLPLMGVHGTIHHFGENVTEPVTRNMGRSTTEGFTVHGTIHHFRLFRPLKPVSDA